MRRFVELWPNDEIWQTASAKLPWSHNVMLMEKLKDKDARIWYAQKAVEHGWTGAILEHQIATDLIDRMGKAPTNFQTSLPAPQSDLAHSLLKDPYTFEFLTLEADVKERELELSLIAHMQKFLVELVLAALVFTVALFA